MWCKEWSTLHLVFVKFKYPFWLTRKHKMRKFLYGKKFFAGQNCNMIMMSFIYSSLAFWLFNAAWHYGESLQSASVVPDTFQSEWGSDLQWQIFGDIRCHRVPELAAAAFIRAIDFIISLEWKSQVTRAFFHPNSFDLNLKFYLNSRINSSKFQI